MKKEWAAHEIEAMRNAIKAGPNEASTDIARALRRGPLSHRPFEGIRVKVQKLRKGEMNEKESVVTSLAPAPTFEADFNKDTGTLYSVSGRIKTVDQLLAKGAVDMDAYEVERVQLNQWEVGARTADGKILVEPLYQVKVWLKKCAAKLELVKLRDEIIKEAKKHAPLYRLPSHRKPVGGYLFEVSPFDLHIGKLAWSEETGEDYDSTIATKRLAEAIEKLIAQAQGWPIERILFVVGNDLLHVDNRRNETVNGTMQDVDSRHPKMFRLGYRAMIAAIDRLRLVAPVDVVVVPGNHDRDSMFKMGEVLAAWYRRDKAVTVDNAPTQRKYYTFGNTLIGFTHGDTEKHDVLPRIMADERPQLWAKSVHRYWHLGHYHKRRATSYVGADTFGATIVEILPSLSGTDAWHAQQGYVKTPKACSAFLYSQNGGQEARLTSTYATEDSTVV